LLLVWLHDKISKTLDAVAKEITTRLNYSMMALTLLVRV